MQSFVRWLGQLDFSFVWEYGIIVAASLLCIMFHEVSHGLTALALGDPTAKNAGRLSFNPIKHVDIFGLLMMAIFRFGWAKPVMINPSNFRDPKKGEILVALAGPAMNFLIAFLAMLFMVLYTVLFNERMSVGLHNVLWLIVLYNINFGVFNLIPIPPLDGSKVLMQLLPHDLQYRFLELERYSFLIFVVMIATPILGYILVPIASFIVNAYATILYGVVGIMI